MSGTMRRPSLVILAACTAVAVVSGQTTDRHALVVILVVDQLRADYLQRYARHWERGFRTLLGEGLLYSRAAYPYANTSTCAGHSTISTGTLPHTHGMFLNAWWDREEGRTVDCTADRDSPDITYGRPVRLANGPRRLLAPALADELRAQRPGSRTVAVSLKARSSIPLAGQAGDAVVWFDDAGGTFVTSRAYTAEPVRAVQAFVDAHPFERDLGRTWNLLGPPETYLRPDAGVGERPPVPWTGLFPHVLTGRDPSKPEVDATFFDLWQTSPLADAYIGELSAALVDAFALGQRDTVDLLGIGFSALDEVGHDFGPDSREVEDVLRHLDATLGRLVAHLDRRVGRSRYILALSADHGIVSIPRPAAAGRVAIEDVREHIEEALTGLWGRPERGTWVEALNTTHVFLRPGAFERLAAQPAHMAMVERAALSVPGVQRIVRRDEIAIDSRDPVVRAVALGYPPARGGDFVVLTQEGWPIMGRRSAAATDHGTLSLENQRVPVLFFGGGVRAGHSEEAATPADIAPTLAHVLGVAMPRAEGRALGVMPTSP